MSSETQLFETITGDDGVQKREAQNGSRHAASLSMTKVADGLIDPKLVLSWLMSALGAPAYLISLLVPIREAGALLPQIAMADRVQRMAHRKWAWVIGSAGQGGFAAAIVLSAIFLEGQAAGFAICGALAGLALSRALCSVSYKDILGKTVEKTRRGSVTGLASSLSAVAVVIFAGLMLAGVLQSQAAVVTAIAVAAGLWVAAALLFSGIREKASEVDEDSGGIDWSILRDNPQLWRFIAARGFLVSTALAPPYFVLLSAEASLLQLDRLGALLLASAAAGLVSSYVWGRFADYSSRQVLAVAGGVGALAMAAAASFALLGWAETGFVMPATLFVLMIAYQGVRQGRSTYLVDMAPEDQRSAYAAVANTLIGILLLAAGALGGLTSIIGAVWALVLFAMLAVLGALAALTLNEVEGA